MPRGRGKNYKGRTRNFTSAEEIDRQMSENWREKKEEGSGESSPDESNSDEEGEKSGGVHNLIEIENPNRVQNKTKKAGDTGDSTEKPELSRREREAIEKEAARKRYEKLHAEGKTDEARADLARLAIIRKQREEAQRKKDDEKRDRDAKLKEAEDARKTAMESQTNAPKPGSRKKK